MGYIEGINEAIPIACVGCKHKLRFFMHVVRRGSLCAEWPPALLCAANEDLARNLVVMSISLINLPYYLPGDCQSRRTVPRGWGLVAGMK